MKFSTYNAYNVLSKPNFLLFALDLLNMFAFRNKFNYILYLNSGKLRNAHAHCAHTHSKSAHDWQFILRKRKFTVIYAIFVDPLILQFCGFIMKLVEF